MKTMRLLGQGMVLLAVCGMMFTFISCGVKHDDVVPSMLGENESENLWLYKYYLSDSLTLKAVFKPKVVIDKNTAGKLVSYDATHITVCFGASGNEEIVFTKNSLSRNYYLAETKIQFGDGTYKAKKHPTLQYSSRDLWLANENAPSKEVEGWMPVEDTPNEASEIIADTKAADIKAADIIGMSLEDMTAKYYSSIPADALYSFKYYLDVPLTLERRVPYDSAAYASNHGYVIRDGMAYERIEIGTDIPGKLVEVNEEDKTFAVCFSSDQSRRLIFDLKQGKTSMQVQKGVVGGKGSVIYGDNQYSVISSIPNLKFYIDSSYDTTISTTKETGGW